MNHITCTHQELPSIGLKPYYKAWGWTLEKAIEDFKKRTGQEPTTIYEIDTEYLFVPPIKESEEK